jgi:hypothetical protein
MPGTKGDLELRESEVFYDRLSGASKWFSKAKKQL